MLHGVNTAHTALLNLVIILCKLKVSFDKDKGKMKILLLLRKVAIFSAFPKCGLPFLCFHNNQRYERFRSELDKLFRFIKNSTVLKTLFRSYL